MIPYGRQSVSVEDIDAVVEVLSSDWLTQGPTVDAFEAAVAEYVEATHAVAFSSGTAALHASAWAAGLGAGDRVFTSPITFMATANAARYVGAEVGLVDLSAETWNLNLKYVPENASAVLPVHYAGLPVDLESADWARRPPVIIEDAAHALGARTPSGPVGNCANSEMTCFSFHPVKPITTGEGGMVTTNNPELAERLRRFRNHGITRNPDWPGWHYEITEVGFHYRMTDIQAALGLSQLGRLDSFVARRNQIARAYRDELSDANLVLPPEPGAKSLHGYHLFPILVENRESAYDLFHSNGIRVQVHYVPIHHHPVSADIRVPAGGFPIAEQVYKGLLSLPMFPDLGDEELQKVIDLCRQL